MVFKGRRFHSGAAQCVKGGIVFGLAYVPTTVLSQASSGPTSPISQELFLGITLNGVRHGQLIPVHQLPTGQLQVASEVLRGVGLRIPDDPWTTVVTLDQVPGLQSV